MKQLLYPHVAPCVIWSGLTATEDGVATDHIPNVLDAESLLATSIGLKQ